MGLIITSSVTYSKNEHFCCIVIDGLLIAATKGVNLFDTVNATAEKAIRKIDDYSQQQMDCCSMTRLADRNFDLDKECLRFFPLFEKYIVNFQKHINTNYIARNATNHVASSSQTFSTPNANARELVPTNWPWNAASHNPNYYLAKSYTTETTKCVTVKEEPREIRVVKRKMLHERQNHIDQSNIGFKMLLGLGWSGGPLGPNQDGIAEPISVELRTRRSGLGCAERQSFRSAFGNNVNSANLFQFLKEYADDDRQYENLEFSDDFSHKEEKKLYGISKDLNLHHETEHRNGMLVVKIMKPIYN